MRVLEPRQFSTQLIPAIAALIHSVGQNAAALDTFAVVAGPGSFTGLRVGLSAIKAMAEATGKPLVAISQLAIMASKAAAEAPALTRGLIHCAMDAGRGELYHGVYADAGRTCIAESLDTRAAFELAAGSAPGIVAAFEQSVLNILRPIDNLVLHEIPSIIVEDALPLAVYGWRTGQFSDVAALDANYLRRVTPSPIAPHAVAPAPDGCP